MMPRSCAPFLASLAILLFLPGSNGGLEFLAAMMGFSDSTECPAGDIRCGSGECILKKWRCDAQTDCKDGSDETDCPPPKCTNTQFMCDQVRCLPLDSRCDGVEDCKDATDELLETCKKPCPSGNFRCNTGQCIPSHWQCDNEKDCKTGEDEAEELCKKSCAEFRWACHTGNQCIHMSDRCDGIPDCNDRSDELAIECHPRENNTAKCKFTEFACQDGKCILEKDLCDGNADCMQGEDEKLASCMNSGPVIRNETRSRPDACLSSDFSCANGDCIPKAWLCDGSPDCDDGSDESSCQKPSAKLDIATHACGQEKVGCLGKNGSEICLPLKKLCDNIFDCLDGSDEGPLCKTACEKGNGQCSHTCNPSPLGPVCSCPNGYVLTADKKACDEVNLCTFEGALSGPCSHICTPIRHGVKCSCFSDFVLEPDHTSCKTTGPAFVGYAVESEIRWFGIGAHSNENGILVYGHPSQRKAGLDFVDTNDTSKIFYTDTFHKEILETVGNPPHDRTILDDASLPEALSYDWMAENLYYTDSDKPEIGVCSVGGKEFHCKKLLGDSQLDSPRGIAVHPGRRFLFFSQWKRISIIERVNLDGTRRTPVISEKIIWPNSIAIDFIHDRLYWLDAHNKWIDSANLDGGDRRKVLHMHSGHPFGITLLGNRVYWSDWHYLSINSVLTNGTGIEVVRRTKSRPMALVSIHSSRQPYFASPCQRIHGVRPCEHICLAQSSTAYLCACRTGFKVLDENRCIPENENVSRPIAVKPPVIGHGTILRTETTCKVSKDCPCRELQHGEQCVCMGGFCRKIMSKPATSQHIGSHVSAAAAIHEDYSTGTLVGIVIASLLFVLVVVVLIYLFRKHCVENDKEHDERSLIDADPETTVKCKSRTSLAGFNNPVYETVASSPSTTNYMVRFYKNPKAYGKVTNSPDSGCNA